MKAETNWDEIKIGDAVMLAVKKDRVGDESTELLVSEIFRDENEVVTHLGCVWDTKDGLKEKKLPIEVLLRYKTIDQKIMKAFEERGESPFLS